MPIKFYKNTHSLLPYVVLGAIVLIAYANIYTNVFLYDDENLILHNPFLRSWGYLRAMFSTSLSAGSNIDSAYYRPLQTLLYTFIFQVFGTSLLAFHFLNVALHAVNAMLVYRLGRALNFDPQTVFLAALLWALHPVHTEAVTYISATADTLYTFFCLSGILILLPDFTPWRILAASLLMILALLSKESAVAFPLLAMSCLYLLKDKRFIPKTYFCLWPLVMIAAFYVLLHFLFLPQGTDATQTADSSSDWNAFAALPVYIRLLLWPAHLHMGHELPLYVGLWHIEILAGIILAIAAIVYIMRDHAPYSLPFAWGLCWFAAAFLPVFTVNGVFFEHWLYLPSVGLFLGIAQSIHLRINKKTVRIVVVTFTIFAAALGGFATYSQNLIWRDPIAFYTNIFASGEAGAKAHINLGTIYIRHNEYEKAIEQNQLAIQKSHDTLALAQTNLAIILLEMPSAEPHTTEALSHLQRALDIDPDFYLACATLTSYYEREGDNEKAAFYRHKAEEIQKKLLHQT